MGAEGRTGCKECFDGVRLLPVKFGGRSGCIGGSGSFATISIRSAQFNDGLQVSPVFSGVSLLSLQVPLNCA